MPGRWKLNVDAAVWPDSQNWAAGAIITGHGGVLKGAVSGGMRGRSSVCYS